MGGGDTKTVQSQQSSQTDPYAPTQPLLQNLIGQLGGINTGVTAGQSGAIANLTNAANNLPDLSGATTGAVTNALGTNTNPQQGMLSSSYGDLVNRLKGTANGDNLNPYSTPGFGDALNTMTNDITNSVKGVYAGSGRDPSGAGSFAGSLGRGLTQGEAPVIQAQANQNQQNQFNAAGMLQNAAGSTASGITQQQLAALQGQFQGLQGAGALPGLLTQNATTQLGAANTAKNQPLQNISGVESLLNPIAALGGQTSGSGTQDTTSSKSLLSNIIGGASGLAGLNGAMGSGWLSGLGSSLGTGASSLMSSLGSLAFLSDENAKENIEKVGELHDGQNVYAYNYKGDNVPQIGLLAQEVEKMVPEAVSTRPDGLKQVRYDLATKGAREIGMLKLAA